MVVQRLKPSQYKDKVQDAIDFLDDTDGSKPSAIIGYISDQYDLDSTDKSVKQRVYRALKQGLEDDSLVKTSSGLYTLATRVRRRPIRRRKKAKRKSAKRKTKRKKAKKRKKGRRGKRRKAKRAPSGSQTRVKRKKRKRRKPKKSVSGSSSQIRRKKGKRTRRRSRAEEDPYAIGKKRKTNPEAEGRPKRQKKSTTDT